MSIHFAASRRSLHSPVARCLALPAARPAANDNGHPLADNHLLRATLLHFAEHGLGAAREARLRAEDARRTGDAEGFRQWLAVCRTLDRRMARGQHRV